METNETMNNEMIEKAIEETVDATETLDVTETVADNAGKSLTKGLIIGVLTVGLSAAGVWLYKKIKAKKAAKEAADTEDKNEEIVCDDLKEEADEE